MAKKWAEVVASEGFQALSDVQKEEARFAYFDEVVKPQLKPGQLGEAWASFDADSKAAMATVVGDGITSGTERGLMANTGRRILDRGSDLIGNAAKGLGKLTEAGGDAMTDLTKMNPGIVWGNGQGVRFVKNMPEGSYQLSDALQEGGAAVRDFDAGYKPSFTWQNLKDKPTIDNLAGYIVEQGGGSIPDMVAALTTLPAYIASRTEEVATDRAQNDGRSDGNAVDYAVAAPTALAMSVLERIGAKGVLGEAQITGIKQLFKEIAKAGAKEAGTEFVQEGMESAATTTGTETGFNFGATVDQAFAGAVAGGGMGVGGRAVTGSIELSRDQKPVADDPAVQQADSAYEEKLLQMQLDMQEGYVHDAPGLEGPPNPADFYSDSKGNVSQVNPNPPQPPVTDEQIARAPVEQQDMLRQIQAAQRGELPPQGFGVGRPKQNMLEGGVVEAQPLPNAELIKTENGWVNPQTGEIVESPAPAFDEEYDSFEPSEDAEVGGFEDVQDYAEFAGMVGVPVESIEGALRLDEKAKIIDTLEGLIADAQSGQPAPIGEAENGGNTGATNDDTTERRTNTSDNVAGPESTQTTSAQLEDRPSSSGFGIGLESGTRTNQETSTTEEFGFGAVVEAEVPTVNEVAPSESKPLDSAAQTPVVAKKPEETEVTPEAVETPTQDIDTAANEAATSPTNNLPQPTEAQIEAGNYKKGHVRFQGHDITIENPKGSTRSGTDPDGHEWSHEMKSHYGYIKRSVGADNEHIDVFVGPNEQAPSVFVVDQVNPDDSFDEHKVMMGYDSEASAIEAYKENYDDNWKVGPVTEMSQQEFADWVKNGDTKSPVQKPKKSRAEMVREKAKARNQSQESVNTISEDKVSIDGFEVKIKPNIQPSNYKDIYGEDGAIVSFEINSPSGGYKSVAGVTVRNFDKGSLNELSKSLIEKHFGSPATKQSSDHEAASAEDRAAKVREKAKARSKKPKVIPPKQKKSMDWLGVEIGTKVTFPERVGYASPDKEYAVTDIGRDGSVGIKSIDGGTVLSFGEVAGAVKSGIKPTTVPDPHSEKPDFSSDQSSVNRNSDVSKEKPITKAAVKSEVGKSPEAIKDFGEKIGGARKDMAVRSDKKPLSKKSKSTDSQSHSYHKDYKPTRSEDLVSVLNNGGKLTNDVEGKFIVLDTRRGRPLRKPGTGFSFYGENRTFSAEFVVADTMEQAEAIAAVAAVSKKHRTEPYRNEDGELFYRITRKVSDRKRWVIKDGFDSELAAKQYLTANAKEVYEKKSSFGEELIATVENPERKGKEYRKGDRNILPAEFSETFGFRGVEFGNWNNQEERQDLINRAYDAFMDLAALFGVPPKAMALNGELAVAFGARGQGLSGARAHYEPNRAVINLTKRTGAGSLAHEWMHAFDHYLARLDGKAKGELLPADDGSKEYGITTKTPNSQYYVSLGTSKNSNLRKEVAERVNALVDTMLASESIDPNVQQEKLAMQSEWAERSQRDVQNKLEKVRNYLATEQKYGKRNTKPASKEMLEDFDRLAKQVLSFNDELKVSQLSELTGSKSWASYLTTDSLNEMAKVYKKVRGRWPFNAEHRGDLDSLAQSIQDYQRRLELIEQIKSMKPEDSKSRTSTDYLRQAYLIDTGRVGDYWSTRHEMLARAFSSYVEDKIGSDGDRSEFLSYGSDNRLAQYALFNVKPFPEGAERKIINERFQELIDVLRVEETDSGVKLFAKGKDTKKESMTAEEVGSIISKLARKLPGLYRVVQSVEDLPDKHKPKRKAKTSYNSARGFFDPETNEVYLIADNIKSAEEAEMTYLHEVVGHFGIRIVFGNKLPSYLDAIAGQIGQKKLKPIAERYGLNLNKLQDRRIAVEEYIAHTAELDGRKPHWFKRLVARVRDWLRSIGLVNEYTNNDIYSLIAISKNETVDSMLAASRSTLESLAVNIESETTDGDVRYSKFEKEQKQAAMLHELGAIAYSGPTIYGRTKATKLETIFQKVAGDVEVMEGRNKTVHGKLFSTMVVRRPNSIDPELRIFGHDTDTPFVEIGGERGTGGVALYIAAMSWAHNNNKTLVPDPRGLSYVNNFRRTEAMLASALREKTTKHLEPAETQFIGLLPDDLYQVADDPQAHPMDHARVASALKELKATLWGDERLASDSEATYRTNVHNLTSASLALAMRRVPKLSKLQLNSKGELYGLEGHSIVSSRLAGTPAEVLRLLKDNITQDNASHGVGARSGLRNLVAGQAFGWSNNKTALPQRLRAITESLGRFEKGQLVSLPARPLVPSDLLRRTTSSISEDEVIYYSLSDKKTQSVEDMLKLANNSVLDRAIRWTNNKTEGLTSERYGALTLRQLGDVAGNVMPHIKHYVSTVHRMMTRRNQLAEDAVTMANDLQKWAQRNPKYADELFEIMHEATLGQVDPADPFVERRELLEKRIKTLKEQMRTRPGEKHLEKRDEIKALQAEIATEPERGYKHRELEQRLKALPPEAKKHFIDVRDTYKARHDTFVEIMEQRIKASEMQDHEKRAILAELRWQHETSQLGGAYFPLSRFGEYWLETTNEDGERIFTTYENKRDQQAAAKKLEEAGHDVMTGKMLETDPGQDGASLAFVQGVMDTIKESGVFKDIREGIQDAVYQLYLQALPTRSMRKQFIHRKGVEGYHKDAIRVFADTMMKNSYQLARLEYMDDLSDQMIDMQKFAKRGGNNRAELYNEMRKRHAWVMNPTNSKWSQTATSIGFVWLLGITPAAALVNTTQNMVVALPVLASKFGWKKAAAMLAKTSGEFISAGRKKMEGKYERWSIEQSLNERERDAYSSLVDMGVIDTTMAHNLAGIAETDAYNYSDTTHKAMAVVSYLFHKAEIYNRETTAISAYRLAIEQGMQHGKAVDYAADAVWDSHFDYSNHNRARFMQGNFAKVALQFKQYSQNISYYLLRNAYLTFRDPLMNGLLKKGEKFTVEQRRSAAVQLGGTLAITAAMGGLTTMPLLTIANFVANAVHPDDEDEPWDALTELKQWLNDTLGESIADRIIWGFGGAGLSSRISLNGLWVREPYRDMEGQDLWTHYAQQAVGPVYGGILVKSFRGAQKIGEGDWWKGAEMMVPKAFADVSKALRYGAEGATTKEGYSLKEDFSFTELALQASGFASHDLMKRYDANSAIRTYEQHIIARRQHLIEQFYLALTMGDKTTMEEIAIDMAQFSKTHPELAVTSRSLKTSIKNRLRNQVTQVNGMRSTPTVFKYANRLTYGN